MNSRTTRVAGTLAVAIGACAVNGDVVTLDDQTFHRYEWRANTFARSAQAEAAIGLDADGNVISVWSSRRQQSGRYGIYAQRFDPRGVAVGSETCLNLWTASHQSAPAIAFVRGGGGWVAWQSHGQDGHAGSIIARRFDGALAGGSEILVNEGWEGHQSQPAVAVAADGTALIVWVSAAGPKAASQVRARLLGPDGTQAGPEFAVGSDPNQPQRTPTVAALPDGGFAVVFAVTDVTRRPAGLRLHLLDPGGQPLGEEIDVRGPDNLGPIEPFIAAAGEGLVVMEESTP